MATDFNCTKTTDEHLKQWKTLLNNEEIAELESEISDYEWYTLLNKDDEVLSIFQIINVLNTRAKNLQIRFNPFKEKYTLKNIVSVIFAIYQAITKICQDKQIYKLKMYLPVKYVNDIMIKIAMFEAGNNKIKNLKKYTNWIEFEINEND